MAKDIHAAMQDYITELVDTVANAVLSYNFSPEKENAVSLVTEYNQKTVKQFVRCARKEYGFAILLVKEYSTDLDEINAEAMAFCQKLMDEIEKREKEKNYPDFPNNCEVEKIENLQNMPNLASVNTENHTARYMIQARVVYFEKES